MASLREERKERKRKAALERSFQGNDFLKAVKPRERYVFHSDYFEMDDQVACVLMYVHNSAARDRFAAFWGVNRIPANMPEGVTTINFEQISRMSEAWIVEHQNKSEGVSEINDNEQQRAGSNTSKGRSARSQLDLKEIAQELNNGASYLNVHNRLLVRAPDLESLEEAISRIDRRYTDLFGTISAAPYIGDQRRELSQLFGRNENKRGKGEYFTSAEFAGSYHLVTHGLEDVAGEYVGVMVGDVNSSAVIFDVNNFRHHVVVATEQVNRERDRAHVADMWGAKMGQACLLDGGRVIHLLLDKCDMSRLGPQFRSFTHVIDMNHGDVNMFEMFGDVKDELAIFPAQMQKLVLMAEQAYDPTESDRSIIRGSLEEVATKFYIEQGMWRENAKLNKDKLRVVGVPHDQVPMLQVFSSYLDMEYTALANRSVRDEEKLHAMSVLSSTFRNLLSNNGDLFNTRTTKVIDDVRGGRRVIYDFSELRRRGEGVAMAQLINIVDFALSQVGEGDLVVIHSAERIASDENVRTYLDVQFDKLFSRGGRVAFLYNSIERMLVDADFNNFDKADYTLLGNMSDNTVVEYQAKLGQKVPEDLTKLVTDKSESVMYIRRGFDNVVFKQQLKLDIEEMPAWRQDQGLR